MDRFQDFLVETLGNSLFNLLAALVILVIGYVVARLVAGLLRRLLQRVRLNERVARRFSRDFGLPEANLESLIATITFWVLLIFVFVAVVERLNLVIVAQAIEPLLTSITGEFLPGLVTALLLLLLAWVLAVIFKAIVVRLCSMAKLDERMTRHGALHEGEQVSISESLGVTVFWLVILLFIPAILDALGVTAVSEPFTQATSAFFAYLPNIVSALIIFVVGWLLARVLRQLVTNLLAAIRVVDSLGERVGLRGEQSLSRLLGTITYAIVMLVILIAALDALDIAAISDPATSMLTIILNAIPAFIGAVLVLVIAYYIARLVMGLVVDLLAGIGFDRWPAALGINYAGTRTPSQLVGYLVLIGIMLFAAVAATDLLNSESLSLILATMVDFFFRVVLALAIIAFGLYFANLAQSLVASAGGANGRVWGIAARAAILILAIAMALRQLGLADDIVNLAFGLILGALALAAALAFGLGGREVAGQELGRLVSRMRAEEKE
jgi:hypothetical protein